LDFTAIGGKRQGREVPQSLRVKPGAKHPVWKTQLNLYLALEDASTAGGLNLRNFEFAHPINLVPTHI
jgi:hypothetical protein